MEALTPRDPKRYTFDNGVNPYGESYSSVFSGGTSAAPAATATPERYSRLPDAPDTPMTPVSDARSALERTIFDAAKPVDEQAIREEKRKNAQAEIDAITANFNRVIQQDREAGQVRADRGRALNIASGLAGSDFGTARAEEIDSKNKEVIRLSEQERDAKIAALLANVNDTASAAIAAQKQQSILGAEKALALMKEKQEEARKQVTELAASGVTLEALKERSPDTYQKLVDTTGDDPLLLEAVFNQAASAKNKVEYTYHSLGDGRVLRTGKKADGTAVAEQIFNYPSLTKDNQLVITPDGTPLIFDKQAGTASIAPGFREGQFMKPESGGGTGSGLPGENPRLYSGLDAKTATAVRAKVAAFKTEPMVQNFATIQDGYRFASSFPNSTTNPADDQALIYALAKALDPGSVVREGEYATAQKYAQSWVKAYGKGIEQAVSGTGFLSETARKNIKATIKSRFDASKASYDNLQKQYTGGIDSLTGRADGSKFLVDYAFSQDGSGPDAELESDIKAAPPGKNREQIIAELKAVYPELTQDQIASKVYALIPDKK